MELRKMLNETIAPGDKSLGDTPLEQIKDESPAYKKVAGWGWLGKESFRSKHVVADALIYVNFSLEMQDKYIDLAQTLGQGNATKVLTDSHSPYELIQDVKTLLETLDGVARGVYVPPLAVQKLEANAGLLDDLTTFIGSSDRMNRVVFEDANSDDTLGSVTYTPLLPESYEMFMLKKLSALSTRIPTLFTEASRGNRNHG